MTPFAVGFLVWLFSKLKGTSATTTAPPDTRPPWKPPAHTASTAPAQAAAAHAAAANQAAIKKPTAQNIRAAFAASDAAKEKLAKQAREIKEAAKTPSPWRAAKPTDLPPWPGGWEPDTPPSEPVVTRAWQLLAELWAKGKGSRKTETIKGRWVTFVAADHGGGKKGVTAFRVKGAPR